MIELDFREPETFKTPDGQEWIINPLTTRKMPLVHDFIRLYDERKGLEFESDEFKQINFVELVEISEEIVKAGIKNKENKDEAFPEKYTTQGKLFQMALLVCDVTTDIKIPIKGDDIPLDQKPGKKKSRSSKQTSTPSSKKPAGKKKPS